MPFLIDGHNLIPKVPGLNLQEVEDEIALVRLLQTFCHRERKQVEVYFDNAPLGAAGTRKFGPVKAVFVRQGTSADDSIRRRLKRLGGEARNWTVVSSDREVQGEARAVGAQVTTAESFASQLTFFDEVAANSGKAEPNMSETEVDEWLGLFDKSESEEEG